MTNAEARFNNSLRPRKPEGSLGRTAQDVHLDSHTAPELSNSRLPYLNSSHVCASTEHRSCVKVEVAVLGSSSVISLMVFVNETQN